MALSVWRLALSMLRVSVRGLSCRTPEARGDSTGAVLGQGQYWIVRYSWELGYVRVAFGALNVESQCSWAVVQNS